MPSETWVAVDIAYRLEVVDEGALVHAALADLESAEMSDEERCGFALFSTPSRER